MSKIIDLPASQTSIEITQPGGPEVLQPTSRDMPVPTDSQVLIEVAAAGVNRPDVFQRMGFYPPPPGVTDIPGLEASGTVVAIGSGVQRWKVGDQVCALLSGGGYAEYAVAEESICLPIPEGLSLTDAAALPRFLPRTIHLLHVCEDFAAELCDDVCQRSFFVVCSCPSYAPLSLQSTQLVPAEWNTSQSFNSCSDVVWQFCCGNLLIF